MLKTAHVQFKDSKYNYYTSVNGKLSNGQIKDYFLNTVFNVGVYPSEIMRKCIKCEVMKDHFNEIAWLNHQGCYTVPESDYGKCEIWRLWDNYLLFEIPTYGGTPIFVKSYPLSQIKEIIKEFESWT